MPRGYRQEWVSDFQCVRVCVCGVVCVWLCGTGEPDHQSSIIIISHLRPPVVWHPKTANGWSNWHALLGCCWMYKNGYWTELYNRVFWGLEKFASLVSRTCSQELENNKREKGELWTAPFCVHREAVRRQPIVVSVAGSLSLSLSRSVQYTLFTLYRTVHCTSNVKLTGRFQSRIAFRAQCFQVAIACSTVVQSARQSELLERSRSKVMFWGSKFKWALPKPLLHARWAFAPKLVLNRSVTSRSHTDSLQWVSSANILLRYWSVLI